VTDGTLYYKDEDCRLTFPAKENLMFAIKVTEPFDGNIFEGRLTRFILDICN